MSQFQLTVATRANQALLLPVLLVATSINEARPSPAIAITYEDTALLHGDEKAIVQFTGASGFPVSGTENALQELRKTFPFLTGKDEKLVGCSWTMYVWSNIPRSTSGFPSSSLSAFSTSRLLIRSFNASTPTSFYDRLSLGTRSLRLTLPSGVP